MTEARDGLHDMVAGRQASQAPDPSLGPPQEPTGVARGPGARLVVFVVVVFLGLAALPLWLLDSIFFGLVVGAVGLLVLAAIGERWPVAARACLTLLAMAYLLPSGCVLISDGFLNYRISQVVVYRAEEAGSLRGVTVETIVASSSRVDERILPGLEYCTGGALFGVHVFLHDDGLSAERGKIDGAYVTNPRTGARLPLTFTSEVRVLLESRTFPDGWIPFQKGWRNPAGYGEDFQRGRCGLRDAALGVDLDSLGEGLLLVLDIHLDKGGRVTTHHLELPLNRSVEWHSGIAIHSP
ncbi:MAG: hypothetical protein AB7N76_03015 [Planctomycetota bacterium]